MMGVDGSRWPAGVPMSPGGDAVGGKGCSQWWVQVVNVGGFLGPCRDKDDLQRLISGWTSLALDMQPVKASAVAQFAAEKVEFDAWAADMANGAEFTLWQNDIAGFDKWGARLDAWRQWYRTATGGAEPSGPEVVEPTEPSSGDGGGIGSILDKATNLLVVAGVVFLGVQLLRK